MALIIEDGTGKADANAYDSIANIEAYLTARGRATTVTEAQVIQATQDIDNLYGAKFSGYKATDTQALQYPRVNAYDGIYLMESSTIPTRLKNALAEMVYYASTGIDINPTPQAGIKRITSKIDVIEKTIEYSGNSGLATARVVLTRVINELKPLFSNTLGIIRRG